MINSSFLNLVLHSMAEGYKKQLIKYKAMYRLTEKQKECVEADDLSKLEEIIVARQYIIKELNQMNNELRPLKADIIKLLGLKEFSSTAILDVVSSTDAQKLADVLRKLGEILYDIKEMDKHNEYLLRKQLERYDKNNSQRQIRSNALKVYKKEKKGNKTHIDEFK